MNYDTRYLTVFIRSMYRGPGPFSETYREHSPFSEFKCSLYVTVTVIINSST